MGELHLLASRACCFRCPCLILIEALGGKYFFAVLVKGNWWEIPAAESRGKWYKTVHAPQFDLHPRNPLQYRSPHT